MARKSRTSSARPRLVHHRQQCECDRVVEVGRQRLGLQSVHGHHDGRVKRGAVELSQHDHHFARLGQLLD
jgi:hypothetical protein